MLSLIFLSCIFVELIDMARGELRHNQEQISICVVIFLLLVILFVVKRHDPKSACPTYLFVPVKLLKESGGVRSLGR
jgi:hypothetical protein